jgi:hypothetical protein
MSSYEAGSVGVGRWDEFVRSMPSGTTFHGSHWLEAVSETVADGYELVGVYKGDRLVGGVGVTVQNFPLGRSAVYTPRLTPYNGVVFRPRDTDKPSKLLSHNTRLCRAVIDTLESNHDIVNLVNHPQIGDIRPFLWAGWGHRVKYTSVVDVADPDRLWDALNSSVRSRVRNCEDLDIEVERASGPAADEAYALFTTVFDRKGIPVPVSRSAFMKLCEALWSAGDLRTYFAVRDGERIAMLAVALDGNGRAHEWQAAASPEHFSTGVAPFLRWKVIGYLSADGIERFDLNGVGVESLAKAKSKFAGDLVPHYEVDWGNSAYRLLKFGWRALADVPAVRRLRRAVWQ